MPSLPPRAALLRAARQPLHIDETSRATPGRAEILVRNRAIAVNPFDGIVQSLGSLVTPWLRYPAVLGTDLAGEVLAVGSGVSRFAPGDRVLGLALGVEKTVNRPAEGAFQDSVICASPARLACHLGSASNRPPYCRWLLRQRPAGCSCPSISACAVLRSIPCWSRTAMPCWSGGLRPVSAAARSSSRL